jgi:hypothetical protein
MALKLPANGIELSGAGSFLQLDFPLNPASASAIC